MKLKKSEWKQSKWLKSMNLYTKCVTLNRIINLCQVPPPLLLCVYVRETLKWTSFTRETIKLISLSPARWFPGVQFYCLKWWDHWIIILVFPITGKEPAKFFHLSSNISRCFKGHLENKIALYLFPILKILIITMHDQWTMTNFLTTLAPLAKGIYSHQISNYPNWILCSLVLKQYFLFWQKHNHSNWSCAFLVAVYVGFLPNSP